MSGHYKLIIKNNKKILKEELNQFKFKDLTDFSSDILKITTGTLNATVINLVAQLEYSFISKNINHFASLKSVNEKFEKKLVEAEKIYNDSIPEGVRGDVNLLFNITNPGYFIAKKFIDATSQKDSLDNYIPFWWFTKHVTSLNFFKTDVKDFGNLFGTGLRFNNILWYNSWLYRDVLIGSYDTISNAINNGLLSNSGIQRLNNIRNMNDLIREYPTVSLVVQGFSALRILMRPNDRLVNFSNTWNERRAAQYSSDILFIRNNRAEYDRINRMPVTSRTPAQTALHNEYNTRQRRYASETNNLRRDIQNDTAGMINDLQSIIPDIVALLTSDDLVTALMNVSGQILQLIVNTLFTLVGMIPGFVSQAVGNIFSGYSLQIKNTQKMLFEDKKEEIKDTSNNNKNNQLKKFNEIQKLENYEPNPAQEIVIKNLLENKKISKYTKQWLEFSKLTKLVKNKSEKEQGELFLKMLNFSMNFFKNIETDLSQSLNSLQNKNENEVSKNINNELNKKYQYELTPQGIAKNVLYNFELACKTIRILTNIYLTDIKFNLKQFDILFDFLTVTNNENTIQQINLFKKEIESEIGFILNDQKLLTSFEKNDKLIKGIFDENSRTYEQFINLQQSLFNQLRNTKKNLLEISNNILSGINDFKELNELKKNEYLIALIDDFVKNTDNIIQNIYQNFIPSLTNFKKIFDINLNQRRYSLKKDFDEILKKMDEKSFDIIYNENKQKFDVLYKNIIDITGDNQANKLFEEKIKKLNDLKEKHLNNIAGLKNTHEKIEKDKENATLRDKQENNIQNKHKEDENIKQIVPVTVESN